MTKRSPVSPAPGPLEGYAHSFDDLFSARAQREGSRRYPEGLCCYPPSMARPLLRPG